MVYVSINPAVLVFVIDAIPLPSSPSLPSLPLAPSAPLVTSNVDGLPVVYVMVYVSTNPVVDVF